jgi:aspartate/methionine/tyrosine aminotransferase
MTQRSHIRSPYMEFAKLHSGAKYNLATSGIMGYPLRELPVRIEDLEINGQSFYGYAPLVERIARKNGVAPECVVYTMGTSMANQLAFAACTEPGDEVLVETPGYELIDSALKFLGVQLRTYQRRFEDGYQVDVEEIERNVTSKTKLIVITNLHNPSGVATGEDTLRRIGEVARKSGARVLVDEVYLELMFDEKPAPAFHLDPKTFVVTNSLTKAFGLSGIRCGWVLAEAELADRMWHIADVYYGIPAHPAELLGAIALDHLDQVAARARSLLETNRKGMIQFLDSRKDLAVVRNQYATTFFPRLLKGSVDRLHQLLHDKYETSIVPGSYFGQPQHFRMGAGGDTEMTREGLQRLGRALDELS